MIKRVEKLLGIVLKRSNIGEFDRIVTLFSLSSGKIPVKAPGIRKITSRRGPHLELFNEVEVSVSFGKAIWVVAEAGVKRTFSDLKKDILLVGLAFYVAEVLDRLLPERQPHPKVFKRLEETFSRLDKLDPSEDSKKGIRIVKEFIVQLLWELGYLPKGQFPKIGVTSFVERIIERRINSKKFLEEI